METPSRAGVSGNDGVGGSVGPRDLHPEVVSCIGDGSEGRPKVLSSFRSVLQHVHSLSRHRVDAGGQLRENVDQPVPSPVRRSDGGAIRQTPAPNGVGRLVGWHPTDPGIHQVRSDPNPI